MLAFDLGASSGRAYIGDINNGRLKIEEIHRFPNDPVRIGSHFYWDILRLFHEIKQGILKAKNEGIKIESIGIDTWAVDFGLIGSNGELLGNPYHYRDLQTEGMMEEVFELIPKEEIFSRTGIQFLTFNTIYQLYALKKRNPSLLEKAEKLLMIPDLLRYFLTGEVQSEFTNATTTQLFNPTAMDWDWEIIEKLGFPKKLFVQNVVKPGTVIGQLSKLVSDELGVPPIPVVAVGEHDTASAVVGVPADRDDFAYLSSGTWSLMGTEIKQPILTEEALHANFTNEGGVENTFRFLKNIMGLWIIQSCQKAWENEGRHYTFSELVEMAKEAEEFKSFIDPDHICFLNPPHMPRQIQEYCKKTNQKVPETPSEIVRCALESLAMKYRYVFENVESLSGRNFSGLHIVGGGINNELLAQFTANSIAKPVVTGPAEASAIGNIAVQAVALGIIQNIKEARTIIRNSFPLKVFQPENVPAWNEAYLKFLELVLVC